MTKDTLYALHLTFSELRELVDAEKLHSEKLKSSGADSSIADRVQKKGFLLMEFSRQKYAVIRAKEQVSKIRQEYEIYTFGADQKGEQLPED